MKLWNTYYVIFFSRFIQPNILFGLKPDDIRVKVVVKSGYINLHLFYKILQYNIDLFDDYDKYTIRSEVGYI